MTNKEILEEIKQMKTDITELRQKVVKVNLVEEEEMEIKDIFFTENDDKNDMMIIDIGAPYSLVGKEWMKKYLDEQKMDVNDLKKVRCSKKFHF